MTRLRVLTLLRAENAGLTRELSRRGHEILAPESVAADLGAQPIGWPTDPHAVPNYLHKPLKDKLDLLNSSLPEAIKAVREAGHLDALVVWTDATPMMRAAVLAAKQMGVPTFEVTHGALNTYRQGHFECESYVDHILAPGQEEADFRTFYGSDVDVIQTGKPSLDWIANTDIVSTRQAIREQLGLPDRRPIVIYGMTWRHPFSTWERDRDLGESDVARAHMALQHVCSPFLVIKPHYCMGSPAVAERVKQAWSEAGAVEFAVYNGPVRGLLPAADLVVSHKSSLLVEAVLLDIPAIGFDFRERNDFRFYPARGIEWVERRDDLLPAMLRCLLDRPTKNRLATERESAKHYFNGPNDGRATQRAADAIENLSES